MVHLRCDPGIAGVDETPATKIQSAGESTVKKI
jgi:hypothetical protein